jgi:hypothetical protein
VTFEPPDAPEGGLPGKQGEFAISLPWAARFGLTAAIGAVLGLAAASVIPARGLGQASAWIIVMAGAIAATYLSIRRVHGWHVSTFVDGTIVGLVAAPLFAILLFARAALVWEGGFTAGSVGQGLQVALYFVLFGALVTVPCGWLAGFAYHVVLSAIERARRGEDESA